MSVAFRIYWGLVSLAMVSRPADAAPVRLGVVVDGSEGAFADTLRSGIEAGAREGEKTGAPVEIIWRESAKPGDRAGQARLVDELTGAKVDAILLAPIDRQVLRGPVESAERAGVPVVVMDSSVDGAAQVSVVSTDNRAAGRAAAWFVGRLLSGQGGVLLLRHQIHAAKTEQREEGFIEVITRDFPGLRLVASDYHAGPTVEGATRVSESLLQRYGGMVDAVFASGWPGSEGMLAALRRPGPAAGKVKLIGSGHGGGGLESALRSGEIQGLLKEDPFAMGSAAAKAALARIRGERIELGIALGFEILASGGGTEPSLLRQETKMADWRASFEVPPCPSAAATGSATGTVGPAKGDFVIPELELAMLAVAPGRFVRSTVGSDSGGAEKQIRTMVTLTRPYWLGRYEVTQRQWTQIMEVNPSDFRGDCLPVDNVGWAEAAEFCRRLTQRESSAGRLPPGFAFVLPTEAQWEFAARAGGPLVTDPAELLSFAWCATTSGAVQPGSGVWRMSTHPVGTKSANSWGFHDLHGNVAEWCLDWHGDYPPDAIVDPRGPDLGTYRVLRGGSWWADVQNCRADSRHRAPPGRHHNALGLRVALSVVAP